MGCTAFLIPHIYLLFINLIYLKSVFFQFMQELNPQRGRFYLFSVWDKFNSQLKIFRRWICRKWAHLRLLQNLYSVQEDIVFCKFGCHSLPLPVGLLARTPGTSWRAAVETFRTVCMWSHAPCQLRSLSSQTVDPYLKPFLFELEK